MGMENNPLNLICSWAGRVSSMDPVGATEFFIINGIEQYQLIYFRFIANMQLTPYSREKQWEISDSAVWFPLKHSDSDTSNNRFVSAVN